MSEESGEKCRGNNQKKSLMLHFNKTGHWITGRIKQERRHRFELGMYPGIKYIYGHFQQQTGLLITQYARKEGKRNNGAIECFSGMKWTQVAQLKLSWDNKLEQAFARSCKAK